MALCDNFGMSDKVKNGRAKWTRLGFFDIDVNPLMIASSLGKHVDLLLRDFGPWRNRHSLANARCEFLKGLKYFHRMHSNQLFIRDQSRHYLVGRLQRLRGLAQFDPTKSERQWCV